MKTRTEDEIDKLIYAQGMIAREEDMSLKGSLTLRAGIRGSIMISMFDEDGYSTSIEFCDPTLNGSQSPRTFKALKQLFVAMMEDQADASSGGGAGYYKLAVDPVAWGLS